MPEIKHQFTGGKMNKDVDERLVPNGEYRDAMNIQVSTSEGSDVGTVQNILGNDLICNVFTGTSSFTVGSISDEKNDALYWLVSGQSYQVSEIVDNNGDWSTLNQMSDSIWRHTALNGCEPVFVDKFAFSQLNENNFIGSLLTSISPEAYYNIENGWTVTGVNSNGTMSNTVTIQSTNPSDPIYVEYGSAPAYNSGIFNGMIGSGFNPMVTVGSSIRLGVMYLYTGDYALLNDNIVYVDNFTGDPAALIGNNIEILTNAGQTSQTFEIGNAVMFDIDYDGGAFGETVLKLTLTTNTNFDTADFDQPSAFAQTADFWPYIQTTSGDNISGNMDISTGLTVQIATGELIVDSSVDVSIYEVGDSVLLQGSQFVGTSGLCIQSINVGNNSIILEDCVTGVIFDGWQVGGMINFAIQSTGGIIFIADDNAVLLSEDIDLTAGYESLLFSGPRTLNFNHGEYITGINIIDNMLFWTDGKTEPKKINIPRSIEGTDDNGQEHTRLINSALNINLSTNVLVREKHITVIRKAPLKAPFLDMKSSTREGIVSGENLVFVDEGGGFNGKIIGDLVEIEIDDIFGSAPDFIVGDTLVLAAEYSSLPNNYDLKVSVVEIDLDTNLGSTKYVFKMQSNDFNGLSTSTSSWYVQLVESQPLFERKLPRFAYRYKYEDNEYSSFSPFTEVAFVPSNFNYEPIKAYNEGMVNSMRSLTLKDFVPVDIPLDVVQVDILYKNEINPTVYLLKSITPTDNVLPGEAANSWYSAGSSQKEEGQIYYNADKGSYKVSSENISNSLPSSQSLRVWDNVPKKAKAQEITGNRIVYGNYETGYNSIQPQIKASLSNRIIQSDILLGKKSIKSLRDYDIGVVWGDKYGRETPVKIAGNSIAVPKSQASSSNYLTVELDNSPSWADYYRFYVKETSNEYYNLAMDRMYDAADGNVWLSFPSVDRNKVDDDTYIILKKGADNNVLVEDKGRYKIVAIENEAPEYIKTSFELLVRTNTDASRNPKSCMMFGGAHTLGNFPECSFSGTNNAPEPGRKGFSLASKHWNFEPYNTTAPAMQLTAPKVLFDEVSSNENGSSTDELYVSFTREVELSGTTQVLGDSKKYHVVNVDGAVDATVNHYISLDSPISPDDAWVTNHVSTDAAISPGWIMAADNIHVHFWKKTIVNKPEFDGRFFVKILYDNTAENNLIPIRLDAKKILRTTVSTDLYKLEDTALNVDDDATYDFTTAYTSSGTPSSRGDWRNWLRFGGFTLTSRWFVDHMPFASKQAGAEQGNTGLYNHQIVQGVFTPEVGADRYSFDQTSSRVNAYSSVSCSPGSVDPGIMNRVDYLGNGDSNATVGMKGVHSIGDVNYIDISYSQIEPNGMAHDASTPGKTHSKNVDWRVGIGPNASAAEKAVVDNLKIGNQFKLDGSDRIYKILQIQKFRLYNYKGRDTSQSNGFDEPESWTEVTFPGIVGGACEYFWNQQHVEWVLEMQEASNRRFTYRIKYEVDLTYSPAGTSANAAIDDTLQPYHDITNATDLGAAPVSNKLSFLTTYSVEGLNPISENPAIFETEPKEEVDIDIYYEASSSIPTFPLNNKSKYSFISVGSTLVAPNEFTELPDGIFVTSWGEINIASPVYIINISTEISPDLYQLIAALPVVYVEKDNGEIVGFKVSGGITNTPGNYIGFIILPKKEVGLNWFNCWSFGNGVESNRIGDTYNKPYVTNGATASSSTEELEETEIRKYGLIYSGLYNSTSSVNNLNQFIAAEKITKDINPTYGSIQKLHSGWGQTGDLVALCEDRTLKILANKDALFNADGNTNVTSTNNVLGTAMPYSGEYGISKNPESFAADAYRVYFTDKVRSTVMRLSKDGLTVISDYGMKDWFRDNLKLSTKLIGSFDDRNDEYNITIKKPDYIQGGTTLNDTTTVSFKENAKGWVSFKSFTPENAISCANEYFSFKGGSLYKHHVEAVNRNTFYTTYKKSKISIVLNEAPGSVKSFQTVSYEGSQARVLENLDDNDIPIVDGQYYNLVGQKGWYVDSEQGLVAAETDLEKGSVSEFIKKEGKWFAYFTGVNSNVNASGQVVGAFDSASFSMQGVGTVVSVQEMVIFGCTVNGDQPNGAGEIDNEFGTTYPAFNYNPSATVNDGSCVEAFYGCMNPIADNWDEAINIEDGSCVISGCTDTAANNYNPNANLDDGSCTYDVLGCTDPSQFNYDAAANTDDGSCIPVIYGCMFDAACNYDLNANTDSGGCLILYGCTDSTAANYDATAQCNDGSCIACVYGCTDDTQFNYNSLATCNDGSCIPVILGCIDSNADDLGGAGSYLYNEAGNSVPNANTDDGSCFYSVYGCTELISCNYDALANTDDGSCATCGDPDAMELLPPGNTSGSSCTFGCTYCMSPINITFNQYALEDGEVRVQWQSFDHDYYGQNAEALSYVIYLDGNVYANVVNGFPNYTFSDGVSMHYHMLILQGLNENQSYAISIVRDCGANNMDALVGTFVVDEYDPIPGCMDNTGVQNPGPGTHGACNWDPLATGDDGSCEYDSCYGCTDATADNYDATATVDDGGCDIYGCMDSLYAEYDSNATTDDGSCDNLCVYGCMIITGAPNFDPLATCDDGTCIGLTYGCLDPSADNYNSSVNTDDGSCVYYGCTDLTANNYDATATQDDASCMYDSPQIGDSNAGGIVFYLDGNGGGLVVATFNQGNVPFGCPTIAITGTSTGIGAGSQNTSAIIAQCATGTTAADLAVGMGTGWHLPSITELNEMYTAVGKGADPAVVNTAGVSTYNIATLNGTFWSSNQGAVPSKAMAHNHNSNVVYQGANKTNSLKVRAIKSF